MTELGSLTPLGGGWSGRTFSAEVAGARVVVRIYPPGDHRGLEAPEVDAAVMSLVRGLVPVPEVLEVRRGSVEADVPGLLITGWVEGRRGDEALAAFDETRRERMGTAMGEMAARLAGMPTLTAGTFTGAQLRLASFTTDLEEWIDRHEPDFVGWTDHERAGLHRVAGRAQDLLEVVGRTSVVHSDLNPKNVLVDDAGDVVAVLDWEYAHSGNPFTDLGNLARFDREQVYLGAVLGSFAERRGGAPDELLDLARSADLWALVELVSRPTLDEVTQRARTLLKEIANTADVHAWPSGW